MSNIPSTPADGNVRTDVVPAIAAIAEPKVNELTAATAVNISCYITAGGFSVTPEQATISDDRECDTFSASMPGRVTFSSPAVTVIDNTNSPNATGSNKAVDTLIPGSTVFIVRRRGIAFDAAYAAGQKVEVYKALVGKPQPVASEANSTIRTTFPLFIQDYALPGIVAAGA